MAARIFIIGDSSVLCGWLVSHRTVPPHAKQLNNRTGRRRGDPNARLPLRRPDDLWAGMQACGIVNDHLATCHVRNPVQGLREAVTLPTHSV
jgi:hypothetical protein